MKEKTFTAKIYLAGNIEIIKQVCRKYCIRIGLCVTVVEVLYIYSGGEEFGVEIGLINYPRFPDTSEEILKKAIELADLCREEAAQWSWLIVTPDETIWNTNRKQ